MKALHIFLLLLALPFYGQTITLNECQELARKNFPLIQRSALISKTEAYTVENLSKGWLPKVNFTAQATYQSDVTHLEVPNSSFAIEPLSKDQYRAILDINQNIYDGAMIKNQKKIASQEAKIDLLKNEAEIDQVKTRINDLFFGILQTDERLVQIQLTKKDLDNGLKKAKSQLKNGTILRSNVDVLQAQILNLEQNEIELNALKKQFTQVLALFIGKALDESIEFEKPEAPIIVANDHRTELKVFEAQKELLESRKNLIKASNAPKINAFAQAGYGKPGLNQLKNEFEPFYIGGLRFNIPLSGLYTKKNERSLLEIRQNELDILKENFERFQNAETIRLQNEIDKIDRLIEKDQELITLRERVKVAALAQLENGVITTNDYIREVNELDRARTSKGLHEIQYLLTLYQWKNQLNN